MTDPPLDPQRAYEALAEALRLFYAQPPTEQALTAVRDAVTRATEIWQQCESHRATSTKEFRSHVVRLKLLLAGVYRTLDVLPGVPLPGGLTVLSSIQEPSIGHEKR